VTAPKKMYEAMAFVLVSKAMPFMNYLKYEELVNQVGREFEKDNPNFKWGMWLIATGIVKEA